MGAESTGGSDTLAQARGTEALNRRRREFDNTGTDFGNEAISALERRAKRENEAGAISSRPLGIDRQNEDVLRTNAPPIVTPTASTKDVTGRGKRKTSKGPSASFFRPRARPPSDLLGFANTTQTTLLGL